MNAASLVNINISSQFVKPRLQTFWSVSYQNHQTVDRKRGCVFPSCPFGILENKAPQMASWLVFFWYWSQRYSSFHVTEEAVSILHRTSASVAQYWWSDACWRLSFFFFFNLSAEFFFFKINRQSQRGQFEGTWSLTRILFLFPFFPPLVLKNIQ